MAIISILKRIYNPAKPSAQTQRTTKRRLYLAAAIVGSIVGFKWGFAVSNKEDNEKYMTEFRSDDQLTEIVLKQKKPVFMYYMVPGEWIAFELRASFLKLAKQHSDKVVFTRVNCAKHFDVCMSKTFKTIPKIELLKPWDVSEQAFQNRAPYQIVECYNDVSADGLAEFLKSQDVIEKTSPEVGLLKRLEATTKLTMNLPNDTI